MNPTSKPAPWVIDIAGVNKRGEFDLYLKQTKQGDKIIYNRGANAMGIHKQAALAAEAAGYVCLVQKRIGKANFEYIAQRTKQRMKSK